MLPAPGGVIHSWFRFVVPGEIRFSQSAAGILQPACRKVVIWATLCGAVTMICITKQSVRAGGRNPSIRKRDTSFGSQERAKD